MKKLLPALTMLIVTIALLGTSTFAWFSMTTDTPVDGMEFNVKTYSNLLIAPNTNHEGDFNDDYEFVNSLTQVIGTNTNPVYLEPISSVNGLDFFYNNGNNARANGQTINALTYFAYSEATAQNFFPVVSRYQPDPDDTYYAKTHYDEDFNDNYLYSHTGESSNNYAYGYIDYNFQLKAQNAQTSGNLDLMLTVLNLEYQGTSAEVAAKYVAAIKAYRVAIFMEEKDSNYLNDGEANKFTGTTAASAANLKAIYTPAGATNFNTAEITYSIKSTDEGEDEGTYVYVITNTTYEYGVEGHKVYGDTATATALTNWYTDPQKSAAATVELGANTEWDDGESKLFVATDSNGVETTYTETIYGDNATASSVTEWYEDPAKATLIDNADIEVDGAHNNTVEAGKYYVKDTATGTKIYTYDVDGHNVYALANTAAAATEWYDATDVKVTAAVEVGPSITTAYHDTPVAGIKAVSSTSALGAVEYNQVQSGSYFYQVAPQTTKYYQVTVRLWLEGEDTTCFNEAFLKLNKDWKFNLQFSLGTGSNVDYLTIAQAS